MAACERWQNSVLDSACYRLARDLLQKDRASVGSSDRENDQQEACRAASPNPEPYGTKLPELRAEVRL